MEVINRVNKEKEPTEKINGGIILSLSICQRVSLLRAERYAFLLP